MKKVKLTLGLLIIPFIGVSQSTSATNTQTGGQTRYLGFDNNFSLRTLTNGVTRMQINGITNAYGVNTSGFIGIGTNNPAAPLHIVDLGCCVQ